MNAQTQLDDFLAKFTPEVAALGDAVLTKLRARFPYATQMVYDNYNFLVIGFGPTDRASQAIFSVALYARGVSLCFLQNGTKLGDPKKILKGTGKQARHIRLENAEMIETRAVKSIIAQAVKLAAVPFDKAKPGCLIIKSVSAKQRPRRPA